MTINARWLWRARSAANWTSLNELLLRDEAGLERDTQRWKFGDGTRRWNDLPYAGGGDSMSIEDLAALIGEDPAAIRLALELGSAALEDASAFDLAGAAAAAELASQPRDSDLTAIALLSTTSYGRSFLTLSGAAAGIVALGLGTAALANTGDFDAAGAAAAAQAFAVQRSNHTGTQAQSTVANLVSDLALKADLVGGVIPSAQIPAIAITEYLGSVGSQVAMLALSGQKGDWAIRSDLGTVWVITGNDPTQLADWTAMSYPTAPVTSVNSQTGAVTLGYADVGAQPVDATLTSLAGQNWAANALPIGNGADTVAQVAFAAGTFPARGSSGNLVAKSISDDALSFVAAANNAAMRTALGATAVGAALFTLTNPGAISFLRVNADNSVTARSDSNFRSDLGLGTAATQNTGTSGANVPLLNGANTWSAAQTFGSTLATSAGVAWASSATAPAQITTAQAGVGLSLSASAAVAGSSVAGAAAGGAVTITAGAAARLTSGNANGGDIVLTAGAGIGTGTDGQTRITAAGVVGTPTLTLGGDTTTGFYRNAANAITIAISGVARFTWLGTRNTLAGNCQFGWASTNASTGTVDTSMERSAAGVVEVNTGTTGAYRDLKLRNLLAGGGNGSYIQTPNMTVANLAAAATAGLGALATVSDATATTRLATVAGGGANKVVVFSDGTNWLIL